MNRQRFSVLIVIQFSIVFTAVAETRLGPFARGTENYRTVPGGDFESTGYLFQTNWIRSGTFTGGSIQASSEFPYNGKNSLRVAPERVRIKPDWLSIARSVPVQPNQIYVLSAFFYTGRASGSMYIQIAANPSALQSDSVLSDNAIALPGINEWQFASVKVTTGNATTSLIVKIVSEGALFATDVGYVDDVALTPIAEFIAPTPIISQQALLSASLFAAIEIRGTVGRPYRIEYSTESPAGSWIPLTNIFLPRSPYLFLDVSSTNKSKRFYRAISLDPAILPP